MKRFPAWIINIAAMGLGFYGFVVSGGIFLNTLGMRMNKLAAMLLTAAISLIAAYLCFRFPRKFMMAHISKRATGPGPQEGAGGSPRQKRLAKAMLFSGLLLLPVFIFALISGIINSNV